MKKIFFLVGIITVISMTAYAQTQRTSRTNSRKHYPADSSKRLINPTDADRNNPTNTTNPNNGTTPNATPNKPDNNNPNNPNPGR